jgi:hypothetical protein
MARGFKLVANTVTNGSGDSRMFWLAVAAALCVSVLVATLAHAPRGSTNTETSNTILMNAASAAAPLMPPPAAPRRQEGGDVFADPYAQPVNTMQFGSGAPLPPAICTKGCGGAYTQSGILVSGTGSDALILPLFGRKMQRDKFQYYTLSNTGAVNTKLPVRTKNKRCTGEYGCDEIYSGDEVYVEGYGGIFLATIYDSLQYTY